MTTANKITLTRIAMIPFFIYFAAQPMLIIDETRYLAAFPTSTVIALVLFCVASFTDFLIFLSSSFVLPVKYPALHRLHAHK